MPGANCAIFGCGTCRNQKNYSLFKLPSAKNEAFKLWRNNIIGIITKDRVLNNKLKDKIVQDTVFVCEKHFEEDQLILYATRKALKEGAIPTLNLPIKSVPRIERKRNTVSIEKRSQDVAVSTASGDSYKDFPSFVSRVLKLKLEPWIVKVEHDYVYFCLHDDLHVLPKFEVYVDSSFEITVRIFGWFLPDTHCFYMNRKRSVRREFMSSVLFEIASLELCQGIQKIELIKKSFMIKHHTVTKKYSFRTDIEVDPEISFFTNSVEDHFYRSDNCDLVLPSSCHQCLSCCNLEGEETKALTRKDKLSSIPASLRAPISVTSTSRVIRSLQEQRAENKELKQQIENLKNSIETKAFAVDKTLDSDLQKIFDQCDQRNLSPFMKLFWEEQMKYIKSNPMQVRYHPMMIKFCLALHAKSPSAYKHLRFDEKNGSGALVLPSQRTLRDYRNYIRPRTGFNPDVISELVSNTKSFSFVERFVVVSFDEMKVQEDLVWNKHTGELVGFVDLGDVDLNNVVLKKVDDLATHVLVFLVKSVVNPLSFSFGCFATKGVSATQLFNLFWHAVFILEMTCNLFVVATTCDGASSNRGFFKMHKDFSVDDGIVYRTPNIFAEDDKFIFFFSDIPHLMKTLRNCLLHSGSEHSSRFMFNGSFHILWRHIAEFYRTDSDSSLRLLPKLTPDHIYLNSYLKMSVKLAVQVLSSSVGNVLLEFGNKESVGTARFCLLADKFFDCGNVRNTREWKDKRKPFLKPYCSVDDERFDWLKNVFLGYFEDWLEEIEKKHGTLPKEQKSRMFISWQTYEGLQMTVHSLVDSVKFLLGIGVSFVLTERFCQDDLENYFGHQRSMGSRKDNPNIQQFRINDNIIKSSITVAPIGGNSRHGPQKFNDIDCTPLPKKKSKH